MLPTPSNSAGHPTIVVGWDGSAASRAALSNAVSLAPRGRVVAVHARRGGPREATAHWQELLQQDALERSEALLQQIPRQVADGTPIEARSVDGEPADALRRVADELDADVIVVGSRGLGEAVALVDSVSQALLRSAGRPVRVVCGSTR
jgi:nucleotide-binding universal stress UspA family protein